MSGEVPNSAYYWYMNDPAFNQLVDWLVKVLSEAPVGEHQLKPAIETALPLAEIERLKRRLGNA